MVAYPLIKKPVVFFRISGFFFEIYLQHNSMQKLRHYGIIFKFICEKPNILDKMRKLM